jgi:LPPG:FO 2-phospho-L-lactate transferase
MKITALAGGVGAGKFLRGLIRAAPPRDLTVIVNTADDFEVHGLHVSPDVDSVTYWLAGLADRERGWGRSEETFRATGELKAFGADGSWFGVGDLDLATHLYRTQLLAKGRPLSEVTADVARRFEIGALILPMTDDKVATRVDVVDGSGHALDLHFQEYWVKRGARDDVKGVRFEGIARAVPAPGVLDAIASADTLLICPSNPIVSIDPILAVPGVAQAVASRRVLAIGVSPIVGGAPLRGMADRLLPVAGVEVSAAGVASYYAGRGVIGGWVIDEIDAEQAQRVRSLGLKVAVTDTIMVGDEAARRLAEETLRTALASA